MALGFCVSLFVLCAVDLLLTESQSRLGRSITARGDDDQKNSWLESTECCT